MSLPPIHKNSTYQIVVVKEPDGKYDCYGVQNRATNVIEAYISNLARAMQVADRFEHDLKHGLKDDEAEEELARAMANAFAKTRPPSSGSSGGGHGKAH